MAGIVLLAGTAAAAQTHYITDRVNITLRTGPGVGHKIVAMIQSGQPVNLLEPQRDWSRIELPDGKVGWVLSRFITDEVPSQIELTELKNRNVELSFEFDALKAENSRLKSENEQLAGELETTRKALEAIQTEHESLKTDSADYFELEANYRKTADRLTNTLKHSANLETELNRLRRNRNIRWFLSGAGVLVFGFIFGYSSRRQRRRSSLL
jgi:SH3 domain protein